LTGDFIDWQGTGLADQGICVDEVEQFVDLGGRQVVRKQDWSETVERTGWMLLVSWSQDKTNIARTLTKDSHKVLNIVWQINGNTALTGLLPIFSQHIYLLAQLGQIMLFNLFLAEDAHDRALRDFLSIHANSSTPKDLPPDVPQVTILPTLPARLVRLLDIQASLQRIAMRDLRTAVDSRFILVPHRRCRSLACKKKRMSIRLARVDDGVSKESDDGDCDEGGVEVPVGESSGDLLIERLEEDGHGGLWSDLVRVVAQ
jgi:hypothetical protein